jgi:hypothetical protein
MPVIRNFTCGDLDYLTLQRGLRAPTALRTLSSELRRPVGRKRLYIIAYWYVWHMACGIATMSVLVTQYAGLVLKLCGHTHTRGPPLAQHDANILSAAWDNRLQQQHPQRPEC